MENLVNICYKFIWRGKCINEIIVEKLDRIIVNYDWGNNYFNVYINSGSFIYSDYVYLCMYFGNNYKSNIILFIFNQ